MIVIYYCYGGAHSSPIASAIHLNILPSDRIPTAEEIWDTPYFDKVDSSDRGRVFPMGEDLVGHKIFICGRGKEKLGIEQAIKSGLLLAGHSPEEVMFVDTLPAVNPLMRIGGYLSRQLGWVAIGRPLVIAGARKAFPRLREIVRRTKRDLRTKHLQREKPSDIRRESQKE